MRVDAILVLDFGGQYSHLISRRIRELNVYSEIVPYDIKLKDIEILKRKFNVKGLILSGGPLSVYELGSPKCDSEILESGIPILGICYGHQLIAYLEGGVVKPGLKGEFGVAYVTIDKPIGVLEGLKRKEKVWMSHNDIVYDVPKGYEILAHTKNCPVASFRHVKRPIYGVQWHPEVIHTEKGMLILRNFVFKICKCEANWTPENFLEKSIEEIKRTVGRGKCIVALSGGVDSSTAALLVAKAIGNRLTAVFIDHGLLREGEAENIKKIFRKYKEKYGLNFITIDVSERFIMKLKGIKDPEEKRRIIGEEFIRVLEDIAKNVGAEYLVQGTIYPDVIESGGTRYADKIKTHHNVGGLPREVKFKGIIEPLRELYKDEVREIALMLGLPEEIVWRQPFPGPGLAVRIIGEVTRDKLKILRKADKIVVEEIERAGLNRKLWQYFAVLLNTKTTGVKGDARAYGYTIAIRAVESKDGMTASYSKLPYDVLEKISTRITNEIPQVTRVVYDITHKPPATIEWE